MFDVELLENSPIAATAVAGCEQTNLMNTAVMKPETWGAATVVAVDLQILCMRPALASDLEPVDGGVHAHGHASWLLRGFVDSSLWCASVLI